MISIEFILLLIFFPLVTFPHLLLRFSDATQLATDVRNLSYMTMFCFTLRQLEYTLLTSKAIFSHKQICV